MNSLLTKDTLIYHDYVFGNYLILDLINDLNKIYQDTLNFENILYYILKYQGFDDETISSLLTLNCTSNIKSVIDKLDSLE